MRTTLSLDEDILRAAKSLAQAQAISLGAAVSELARRGLQRSRPAGTDDFPVFRVSPNARAITLEDVKSLEDEE
jgi:hypothetical protein